MAAATQVNRQKLHQLQNKLHNAAELGDQAKEVKVWGEIILTAYDALNLYDTTFTDSVDGQRMSTDTLAAVVLAMKDRIKAVEESSKQTMEVMVRASP